MDRQYSTPTILLNRSNKQKNVFVIISVVAIGIFAYLAYLFPFMCDDWAWGSAEGIQRFQTFYENYNGRYLGNILVTLITRSKLLDVILMSLSYYGVCLLCCKYTTENTNASLLFALVLFFAMPKDYFVQAIAWTSGYANYVPSAILSGLYLYLIRNITDSETPQYSKYFFVLTFFLGFCNSLFIENITLFNICLGFAVILWTKIKFKKVYLSHCTFFIGALVGALWMFSNGAYTNIANGFDGYRNVPKTTSDIIATVKSHLVSSIDFIIFSNWLMCIVTTILLSTLAYIFFKKANKRQGIIVISALTVNIICMVLIILKNMYTYNTTLDFSLGFMQSKTFQVAVAFFYVIPIPILVLICVDKGRRFRMLLPFYCVPVVIAPLLVVNPITARCFMAAYIFMMMFLTDLFSYVMRDFKPTSINYKAVSYFLSLMLVLQTLVYILIFYPIHTYDLKRNAFAKLQAEAGAKTVYTCHLPNLAYLWISSPSSELYATRYKSFHNLDSEIVFEFVSLEELDKLIESYKSDNISE